MVQAKAPSSGPTHPLISPRKSFLSPPQLPPKKRTLTSSLPPLDHRWSKKTFDLAKEQQEHEREQATILRFRHAPTDGDTIADQAKALREGRARWTPGWQQYGGARVVVRRDGGGKEDGEDGEVSDGGWMYGDGGARKDRSGQ